MKKTIIGAFSALLVMLVAWAARETFQLYKENSIHCLAWSEFEPNRYRSKKGEFEQFMTDLVDASVTGLVEMAMSEDPSVVPPTEEDVRVLREHYSGIYSGVFMRLLLKHNQPPYEGMKVAVRNVSSDPVYKLRVKFSDFDGYEEIHVGSSLTKSEVRELLDDVNVDSIDESRAYTFPVPLLPDQEVSLTLFADDAGRCSTHVSGQLESKRAAKVATLTHDQWLARKASFIGRMKAISILVLYVLVASLFVLHCSLRFKIRRESS
ncbi:MAG: hypothetical protein BWY82_00566 [Verrucomicrobia bacterium ADurb.Bin474]|nr:MAG: hypothetical protein BWY82_00566 [Verrucomicrobia bacterium ADurb.Bin474]